MPLKTAFVNNNQAVERQVALMSTCGKKVVGEDRKSGQQIAVSKRKSRKSEGKINQIYCISFKWLTNSPSLTIKSSLTKFSMIQYALYPTPKCWKCN